MSTPAEIGDNGQAHTDITRDEIEQVLTEFDALSFTRVDHIRPDLKRTYEYVYEAPIADYAIDPDGDLKARVYSSVSTTNDEGRGCGRDSIKQTIVLYPNDGSHPLPVHREPRTHRIRTETDATRWMENLKGKLYNIVEVANSGDLKHCRECDHLLCIRDGKHGKFWGCTAYPECTHTEPYGGPTKQCDRCGSPMVKRDGDNGQFWGCSTYPDCTYTTDITADD